MEVRLGTSAQSAERDGHHQDRPGRARTKAPGPLAVDGETLEVDEVLVATGRVPNIEPLPSGDRPGWLHLIGDVSGEPALTHWGKYRARLLGARLRQRRWAVRSPTSRATCRCRR